MRFIFDIKKPKFIFCVESVSLVVGKESVQITDANGFMYRIMLSQDALYKINLGLSCTSLRLPVKSADQIQITSAPALENENIHTD